MPPRRRVLNGIAIMTLVIGIFSSSAIAVVDDGQKKDVIDRGVEWLANQQNSDGSWVEPTGGEVAKFPVGVTGLVVMKLGSWTREKSTQKEKYKENISRGIDFILNHSYNDNDLIYFHSDGVDTINYETSTSILAITNSMNPDEIVSKPGKPLDGKTYRKIVELAANYLITKHSSLDGGWTYDGNLGGSDNSNTGFAVLALDYANKTYCIDIPLEERDKLKIWRSTIQCEEIGNPSFGGATYSVVGYGGLCNLGCDPSNRWGTSILNTGNLLFEMAFARMDKSDPSFAYAINFTERYWRNKTWTPGWIGPGGYNKNWSNYQATYILMKGLEVNQIETLSVNGQPIVWFDEVASKLIADQKDNHWNYTWETGTSDILGTTFALLTLEKEIPREARISISKAAEPPEGCPCTNVTFTINVINSGDYPIETARVIDVLPAGMMYKSSVPPVTNIPTPDPTDRTTTLIWDNVIPPGAPLQPGESILLSVTAHIEDVPSGTLVDNVKVEGTAKTPCPKSVSAENESQVLVFNPNIEVIKTADPNEGCPCNDVTFTIQVTNTGDYPLDKVRVEDTLPAGLSFKKSEPPTTNQPTPDPIDGTTKLIWDNLGPLGIHEKITIKIIAHIDKGSGPLVDKVIARGTPKKPCNGEVTNESEAAVTVFNPKIAVKKTATPSTAMPSDEIRFTITVTNTGDYALNPVKVSDTLPVGMTYLRDDMGGVENPIGTITWIFGPLNSGASKIINMYASIDSGTNPGVLTDSVIVTGDSPCGPTSNNATANVTVNEEKPAPHVKSKPNKNSDSIEVGDDTAVTMGDIISHNLQSVAVNNLEIKKNQNSGACECCQTICSSGPCQECCNKVNLEKIKAGSRKAMAFDSALATNNVKIVTNQQ